MNKRLIRNIIKRITYPKIPTGTISHDKMVEFLLRSGKSWKPKSNTSNLDKNNKPPLIIKYCVLSREQIKKNKLKFHFPESKYIDCNNKAFEKQVDDALNHISKYINIKFQKTSFLNRCTSIKTPQLRFIRQEEILMAFANPKGVGCFPGEDYMGDIYLTCNDNLCKKCYKYYLTHRSFKNKTDYGENCPKCVQNGYGIVCNNLLLHEIGHCLGLSHTHKDDSSDYLEDYQIEFWDTTDFSVMSYCLDYCYHKLKSPRYRNNRSRSFLGALDILALQKLYGSSQLVNSNYSYNLNATTEKVDALTLIEGKKESFFGGCCLVGQNKMTLTVDISKTQKHHYDKSKRISLRSLKKNTHHYHFDTRFNRFGSLNFISTFSSLSDVQEMIGGPNLDIFVAGKNIFGIEHKTPKIKKGRGGEDVYIYYAGWGKEIIDDSQNISHIILADKWRLPELTTAIKGQDLIITHTRNRDQLTIRNYKGNESLFQFYFYVIRRRRLKEVELEIYPQQTIERLQLLKGRGK